MLKNNRSGQVILETAIVLVSLAVIAVSSMALFSNLKLNLTARQDLFRRSRLAAVNNITAGASLPGNALNPLTYLDYSPHQSIIIPDDGDPGGYFDPIFYVDPRIEQAELLLDEADNIINILLPFKINQAYQLLGGDRNDYDYILENVTYEEVRQARDLCREMLQDKDNYNQYNQFSAPRAYDNFFEDMNGNDSDADNFVGAIGLLQQVLDDPIENGPFDPDLDCLPDDSMCNQRQQQNLSNRQQLQSSINNLKQTEQGLDILLNEQLIPRLRRTRNYLNTALSNWNDRGWLGGYWTRVINILKAKEKLKKMLDFVGEIEDAIISDDLAHQIQQAYNLLLGSVSYNEAVRAKELCYQMLQNPEIYNQPNLDNLVEGAYNDLNAAIRDWANATLREHYLNLGREKLEILNDIVEIED